MEQSGFMDWEDMAEKQYSVVAGHDRKTGGLTTGKVGKHGTGRRVRLKTGMRTVWASKLRGMDISAGWVVLVVERYRIHTINDYRMEDQNTKGSEIRDLKGIRIL